MPIFELAADPGLSPLAAVEGPTRPLPPTFAWQPGPGRLWSPRRPDGEIRWTWHVLLLFLTCPRKWLLSVEQDLMPERPRSAPFVGSATHQGLEGAFRAVRSFQEAGVDATAPDVLAACEGVLRRSLEAFQGLTASERDLALRVLLAYWRADRYGRGAPVDLKEWTILDVETSLPCDLRTLGIESSFPVLWEPTVDLVVRVGPPAHAAWHGTWIVEHTTAAQLPRGSFESFRRDGQCLSGLAAAKASLRYPDVRGVIRNVLVKSRDPQTVREYIEPTQREIVSFAKNVALWQRLIEARRMTHGPYPEDYSACWARYGACDYLPLCQEGEGMRSMYRERGVPTIPSVDVEEGDA